MKMEAKFVLFCILFLLDGGLTQDTPTIGFISPDEEVDVGGEVEMICQIKNGKEYPIMWMRLPGKESPSGSDQKSYPITSGKSLLFKDPRLTLESDDNLGTYTLKISNVKITDEAVYQCQVLVALNNMVTREVELKVKREPTMTDEGSPNSVRVTEGEKAVLVCEARGVPVPLYKWSRADKRMMYNGRPLVHKKELTIEKVRKEDRGQYICTASNGVGSPAERKIDLEVEFPPTITAPKPRVPQALEFDSELSCQISAFPPPTIYWKRGNDTITNSRNYKIAHFASQGEVITTTLKITETQQDQFGNYTCQARNLHGHSNMTVELYRSKIAICPPVCGDVDLTSGSGEVRVNLAVIMLAMMMMTFRAL